MMFVWIGRNVRWWWYVIVILVAVAVIALTGCGNTSGGSVTVDNTGPTVPPPTTVPDDVFIIESGKPNTSGWFVTVGPSGTTYECVRPSGYNAAPMNCFPMVQTQE